MSTAIKCPGCYEVGTYTKVGWVCRNCPSPMPPGSTIYHKCKDGTVRIVESLAAGEPEYFSCGRCKGPTRGNVQPSAGSVGQDLVEKVGYLYDYFSGLFVSTDWH